jgi:hypothetical protein
VQGKSCIQNNVSDKVNQNCNASLIFFKFRILHGLLQYDSAVNVRIVIVAIQLRKKKLTLNTDIVVLRVIFFVCVYVYIFLMN